MLTTGADSASDCACSAAILAGPCKRFAHIRLPPAAWLRGDHLTGFERIATASGRVTLRLRLADGGRTLDITFEPAFRDRPRRVLLHVPALAGLERLVINGRKVDARPGERLAVEPLAAP
jgi:hypothetical protein